MAIPSGKARSATRSPNSGFSRQAPAGIIRTAQVPGIESNYFVATTGQPFPPPTGFQCARHPAGASLSMMQILEAEIIDLSHDGRGVARVDGKTVFVAGGLPGERVRVRRFRRH